MKKMICLDIIYLSVINIKSKFIVSIILLFIIYKYSIDNYNFMHAKFLTRLKKHQTYNCPRDQRLSASCGKKSMVPRVTTSPSYWEGFLKGVPNLAPIMLRDASLSDSECNFFKSDFVQQTNLITGKQPCSPYFESLFISSLSDVIVHDIPCDCADTDAALHDFPSH